MSNFTVLYDEPQEADWFCSLHPELHDVECLPISACLGAPELSKVLKYDRPDIILLDGGLPILVVEETVEVPSGHNVGQRFGRIAAAAEAGVPAVYICPYVARKHGGDTEGPRYMNLRLFGAIDNMVAITGTAVTTINWPVDARFEVLKGRAKDQDMLEYIAFFLDSYRRDPRNINRNIRQSPLQGRLLAERNAFGTSIRSAARYAGPPPSVNLLTSQEFAATYGLPTGHQLAAGGDVVLYHIGMNQVRSDPFTGTALLYKYLYAAGRDGKLVLSFQSIPYTTWKSLPRTRKDIRMFTDASDAIIFSDRLALREEL